MQVRMIQKLVNKRIINKRQRKVLKTNKQKTKTHKNKSLHKINNIQNKLLNKTITLNRNKKINSISTNIFPKIKPIKLTHNKKN